MQLNDNELRILQESVKKIRDKLDSDSVGIQEIDTLRNTFDK
jgi:hypothetical protein